MRARPDFRVFGAVILILALYRILFVVTYPINIAHDADNYLRLMIMKHASHLIHAGGYPFFVNLFFFWVRFPDEPPVSFLYGLQVLQHGVELLSLSVLFFCLSDLFNKWIAALALIFVGMDIDAMAFTNASSPEWLQADALVLSCCAAYRGFVAKKDNEKTIYYALSSASFVLAYLVKFNTLVFVVLFVPIYLFEKSSRKRLFALAALLAGVAVYALFMISYHYPSTRSRELTADASWIFMEKLYSIWGNYGLENMGVNTKRLIALNGVLPNRRSPSESFSIYRAVDSVPDAERTLYRDRYLWLLRAEDPELDLFVEGHPLPKDFHLFNAYIPVAYYFGLQESDRLCTKVFIEVIHRHMREYLERNLAEAWEFLAGYPGEFLRSTGHLLPISGGGGATGLREDSRQDPIEKEDLGFGFVRIEPNRAHNWGLAQYYSPWPVLWRPGHQWFSLESRFALPNGILLLVFGLLAIYVYRDWSQEGFTLRTAVAIFILVAVPGFMTFSKFLYFFRDKELRLLWPMVGTAYAIVAWSLGQWSVAWLRRVQARIKRE